jgi:chemotaxis protein methyltransferase CheR
MNAQNDLAPLGTSGMPGVSPDVYDEKDFRAMARLVREEAGIVLPPGKATLVYSRLAPLVRGSGLVTFSAFIDMIRLDATERRKAVCALTTNHTFFFREAHHFDHFIQAMRPRLVELLDRGEAVRLWSAGSSSGEEVFSLTLALLGPVKAEGCRIATRDIRILASDIADHALHKAAQGRYELRDTAAIPTLLRDNWTTTDSHLQMGAEARGLVQFKRLNLQGDWPMRRPFQVIFCRNVMIYFDQPTKERLVERLARQLVPGGFLYIGHSERVSGPGEALLAPVGPTIYQRT